jgi:hypothetical protein
VSAQLSHSQAFELLPWLVNGTLTGSELACVQMHVRDCLACRLAVREQQQLRVTIQEQPTVPLSAEQGFDRLLRQMEPTAHAPAARGARSALAFAAAPFWARAAAVAVVFAAGGGTWFALRDGAREGEFATLARDAALADVRLDIIFATSVVEGDMRALVNEVNGTIVGGPSALGRYTIRLNATDLTADQVHDLIERLGKDERIRFAGRSLIEERAP